MFNVLNHAAFLRAALFAAGMAASMPALAETDAAPLPGTAARGALSAWSGPASAARPAVGPDVTVEPGSVGDVRGAFGPAGRTPLAALAAVHQGVATDVNVGAN